MTSLLPPHISYSQYQGYKACPRNWYLGYIRQAESVQTWYAPIGTAVHSMIEAHLDPNEVAPTAEEAFFPLISAQMEIEPDLSKWKAGGKKDAPITGDLALQRVKDCYERALEFLDDLDVWEVEFNASGRLPGLQVEIKAFVDTIGEYKGKKHKKYHGPMIVDWKTGSTKPDNFQLTTYAALLQIDKKFWNLTEDRALKFSGRYAMLAPGASDARPVDLSDVDPAAVGAQYQEVRTKMEAMQIQSDPAKFKCEYCFNNLNCLDSETSSGLPTQRQLYYDRSRHDQPPF